MKYNYKKTVIYKIIEYAQKNNGLLKNENCMHTLCNLSWILLIMLPLILFDR